MAAPSSVVLTGVQGAQEAGGGPGKFWIDKSNAGYSGTPLWKLREEQKAALEAAQASADASFKVPESFVRRPLEGQPDLYWSDKRQLFWKATDGKYYVFDDLAQAHVEVHEASVHDIVISVGGVCHERAGQVKNVIVKDLIRAAQAMRLNMDHLDQPCAMLLPKLAAFKGYWVDERLKSAMRQSFEELDASFIEKHPGVNDGCSAAVALLTGERLVVASLGDVACCAVLHNGETERLVKAHAVPDPDAEDDSEDEPAKDASAGAEAERAVPWTRALGDADQKLPALGPLRLLSTPEVNVIKLREEHHGFAFVCRALFQAIGRGTAVSTVFRRSNGRPRMAAGALIDAAVQYLGQVNQDSGMASVVAFLETRPEGDSASGPPAKRRKADEPSQVRLRHILLKHKECKSTVDKVRNRQVRRTRGEAERLLRGVLEECDGDTSRKKFTQRCREMSECPSCLKAGELAGDLNWIKRGDKKFGEAFHALAFSLKVNQMSDLIDTDMGVHVLLRTA